MGNMIKTAVIGPLLDIGSYGVPSGVGYLLGRSKGRIRERNNEEYKEHPYESVHQWLVPGAFGYHQGLRAGHLKEKNNMQNQNKKPLRKR